MTTTNKKLKFQAKSPDPVQTNTSSGESHLRESRLQLFSILVLLISGGFFAMNLDKVMSNVPLLTVAIISLLTALFIIVFAGSNSLSNKTVILNYLLVVNSSFALFFASIQIEDIFIAAIVISSFFILLSSALINWKPFHQIVAGIIVASLAGLVFFKLNLFENTSSEYIYFGSVLLFSIAVSVIFSFSLNRLELQKETAISSFKEKDQKPVHQFKAQGTDEAFDSIPVALFKLEPTGRILFGNQRFAEILGYKKNEILDLNFQADICANPGDRNEIKLMYERSGKVSNYRIKLKRKDKSEITVKLSGKSLRTLYDEVYYEESIEDITEFIREEEERNKEFEEIKKEKQKAQNEVINAQYSSHIKTRFIANMSHEIRTPMNSVLGFLTLIENGLFESEEELRDFARNAKISAESLLDIINNILDISKIEAGKMELFEDEFALKDEVDKAYSICMPAAREKGLQLNYKIENEVPQILIGDSTRYRQILVNLLNNSVKYTRSGSIEVNISVIKKTEATIKLQTKVTDTGKGIPKDKINSLFKPFTQLVDKKWGKEEGTGLGLMICKEFVSLMDGEIGIESEVDKGTTVTLTTVFSLSKKFLASQELSTPELSETPDEVISEEPKTEEEEKVTISSLPRTIYSKYRILLVEDNPISQNVELKLLREIGYSVDAVSNGYDAIEAVKTNSFSLVLMDIEMNDMNGITATKKIRELDGHCANIPIIAVTAHSSMKDREKCLAAGMNDYIAKPININFLKMTIDNWLRSEY